jgi:hypothetical protein
VAQVALVQQAVSVEHRPLTQVEAVAEVAVRLAQVALAVVVQVQVVVPLAQQAQQILAVVVVEMETQAAVQAVLEALAL